MDAAYDSNLTARLLLTLVNAGICIGLNVADMNKTHATNPLWTPHARFHVVWQVLSNTGLALIGLVLIWSPGPLYVGRLYLASALAVVVLLPFYAALAAMGLYGGANYDVNGYLPKKFAVAGTSFNLDANTTVFTILSILLVMAVFLISPA